MALREEFEETGNWFFRWRSYLPLLTGILFLLALKDFHYLGRSTTLDWIWEIVCFAISLFGAAIRMAAVGSAPAGTSGRNVLEQRAEVLNTTGVYSIVRHPLYLGNFFIWCGIVLSVQSWWFSGMILLIFWLYYEKIIFAEEEFLRRKFGAAFLDWAQVTPAFIPDWTKRRPPDKKFEFRRAFQREFAGVFAVVSVYSVLDAVEMWIVERRLGLDWMWIVLLPASLFFYLLLFFLKKIGRLKAKAAEEVNHVRQD